MYNELLEKLAVKLGTTTEYLWGILVKQAVIDGIQSIIFFVLTCIGIGVLYMLHKKFLGVYNDHNFSYYYKFEEALIFPMVTALFIFGILFIYSFASAICSITAFVNPEYWALDQILKTVRGCK